MSATIPGCIFFCQLHRYFRHFFFRAGAVLGYSFYHMPVMVAGRKIHCRINIIGIFFEHMLNHTHGLNKPAPFHRAYEPKTSYAVTYGNLVCCLLLVFCAYELCTCKPVFRKALFHPGQRQCKRLALPHQATRKLCHKRAFHRRHRPCHIRYDQYQALRVVFGGLYHLVRPITGQILIDTIYGYAGRYAAQVFYQREAQHYGYGPQFS